MLVRNHMSRTLKVVEPSQSLDMARSLLQEHRIRHLPVLLGDKLIGIVSDRDLKGAPARARTVRDVMTTKPIFTSPDASMDEAARVMQRLKISALPVLEQDRPVGIITTWDVLDAFVSLSGISSTSYRIIVNAAGQDAIEALIASIVKRCHGELQWIHRETKRGVPRFHLRVKKKEVEDIVTALEAAGIEVTAVVGPPVVRIGKGLRKS